MENAYDKFLQALRTTSSSSDLKYPGAGVYLLLLKTIMEACHFLPFLIPRPPQGANHCQDRNALSRRHSLVERATADFMVGAVRKEIASLLSLIPKEASWADGPVLGFFNFFCNNGCLSLCRSSKTSWFDNNQVWEKHLLGLLELDLAELGPNNPLKKCLSVKQFLKNVLALARDVHFHHNWFTNDIQCISRCIEKRLIPLLNTAAQSRADDVSKTRLNASLAVAYLPTLVAYDLFAPYLHKLPFECCILPAFPLIACMATCSMCSPSPGDIDTELYGTFAGDQTCTMPSKSSRRRKEG